MVKKKATKPKEAAKEKTTKQEAPKEKAEKEIGKVTHYFTNIGVAVIKVSDALKQEDTIHVKGASSDFKQKIDSMQIEHDQVKEAKKGQSIGLKVKEHAREGDAVYKV